MTDVSSHNAVIIDKADNVAVVIYPIKANQDVVCNFNDGDLVTIKAVEDIPQFHKISLTDIFKGDKVIKYGEYIGFATEDIKAGQHIHVHNCASSDDLKAGVFAGADEELRPINNVNINCTHSFNGFKRDDGSVGIRNHVLILPTSICATDVCEKIASSVPGCVTFNNQNGCSQVEEDQKLTVDTIAGLAANPNIYSVLAISLGCEFCSNQIAIEAVLKRSNKLVKGLIIQQVGGSQKTIEQGCKIAQEMVDAANKCKREKCGVDQLIFGSNCGGSDTTSGLGANPLIGKVSDWFVSQGATSVLCETPEIFGGEHILARRSITPAIGEKVLKMVYDYEDYVKKFGAQMREGNPSPGNMEGGLTTLEEKSLGCIHKGGISPVNEVYAYAQKIEPHKGLVLMDTPGNDASSVGGIIAGGCQLVVFSTGRGTPTGNAIAPVYRITANPQTAKSMADDTDMDVSETIFGPRSMDQLKDQLIANIIDICNGELTCAEKHGFVATALPHLCNYI